MASSERDPPDAREPLTPRRPKRVLAWLSLVTGRRPRTRTRPWLILALIAVTLALGTWGFHELALPDRLNLLQSLYHAAKLYTLELGLVAGTGSSKVGPNWQILVAFVLAALLVIRALLALAGGLVRRVVTRRLLSGHVIVCGAGVHGSALAHALADEHDVVLLDTDATAPGMRDPPREHEWRIVANAVDEDALLGAGVRRANWLVAITGDDFTNSEIVSTLYALGRFRDRLHVLVQMEDPSLARFLEDTDPYDAAPGDTSTRQRSGEPARPVVTPFSPNAIAADALLLERARVRLADGDDGPLLAATDERVPYVILAGEHPLLDAIVLAALRHWRVRVLRERELRSGAQRPPMRIGVYGPGASARVDRLMRRWLPEPDVLELEAKDAEQADGVSLAEAGWLAERRHAAHAFVACTNELSGVELSLAVSRILGAGVLMTRVSTKPPSLLDERLQTRTAGNPQLAATEVLAIDDLACDRHAIEGVAARRRLARALESDFGEAACRMSEELLARLSLGIHTNPMWRVLASEAALIRPLLAPVPISAMVAASLSIELESPHNLRASAELLASEGQEIDAFSAWCEYARHVNGASSESERSALTRPAGEQLADAILRMRAATLDLGDTAAEGQGAPGVLTGKARVTIFAGAAGSMTEAGQELLAPMLSRALAGYDGEVLSGGSAAGLPGLIGQAARELGLDVVGYVPAGRGDRSLYATLRETAGASEFSVREPLQMWSDILAAGVSVADVRLVACPGGPITQAEILLARALGAPVAWLDPASESVLALDDTLPFGADGVLELPPDAMTLRAFFRWSAPPADLPYELRDSVARYVHADYRRRQRRRKPSGDAALAPWDQLLPALQRSNLAQAEDIPNKLAAVALCLERAGRPLQLEDEQIELLAEIEHGRWNVERLRSGWRLGERQVSRMVSSHLRPWTELDEEAKEFDREAVRNIAPALAAAGWGVRDRER